MGLFKKIDLSGLAKRGLPVLYRVVYTMVKSEFRDRITGVELIKSQEHKKMEAVQWANEEKKQWKLKTGAIAKFISTEVSSEIFVLMCKLKHDL